MSSWVRDGGEGMATRSRFYRRLDLKLEYEPNDRPLRTRDRQPDLIEFMSNPFAEEED